MEKELIEIVEHFNSNLNNLTEWFGGEKLESILLNQYIKFLWKWFGVVKTHTSADLTIVHCETTNCGRPNALSENKATKAMNNKLLDLEFMKEFFDKELQYRREKDPTCIKRGIANYKKLYNLK